MKPSILDAAKIYLAAEEVLCTTEDLAARARAVADQRSAIETLIRVPAVTARDLLRKKTVLGDMAMRCPDPSDWTDDRANRLTASIVADDHAMFDERAGRQALAA